MSNEQWKSDGDCTMCRRQKYCKKPCSASKKRIDRIVMNGAAEFFEERLCKADPRDEEAARQRLEGLNG